MLLPSVTPPESEPALEPDLPIIDAHHHLWDQPPVAIFAPYDVPDFLADLATGHRIIGTVFVDAQSHYRTQGPDMMRPVGETEWVAQVTPPHICQAIVGHADLTHGFEIGAVLDAHRAASPRFRGVRHMTAYDPDIGLVQISPNAEVMRHPGFTAGLRELAKRGLSFDAWMMQHQLPQLVELAQAVPEASIVLDHFGGPMAVGRYAGRRADAFADWRAALAQVAACPNVTLKLGALNMTISGRSAGEAPALTDSEAIAARQRDLILTAIDLFGPNRCMVESNFPVDRGPIAYSTLWNVFKRLTSDLTPNDRSALFTGTARRVYRMAV